MGCEIINILVKRFILTGISISVMLFAPGVLSCGRSGSNPVESISIGTTTSEVNSLIIIAQEQGYFYDNGLNINHIIYPSGVAALDGMLNNEVDIATGSEFAFAGDVLSGKDIRSIASIARSSIEALVARRDRGINDLTVLKGKKIGVPLGSRPEFALDRFLLFNGLDTSAITLVNVPVNRSVEALVNGEVDAVAAWQPYINRITEQMGNEVVIWNVQEGQPSYTLVMCTEKWIGENPELAKRFLKALVKAEAYIADNPLSAKSIIQQKLNYEESYMSSVWPDYDFSITLDQALILTMEDEVRWVMSKKLSTETTMPNFLDTIHTRSLKEVKPKAVGIIGS
jgi:ABC-type nitrate/sulfonate/bicarbonate transport system substrate-binding protein